MIKYLNSILFFAIITSCVSSNKPELFSFDLTGNYSEKEMDINRIAEIEYILLETKDDFLYDSYRGITENFIITENTSDKSFVFFSREGKVISKISRRGNGPEEYDYPLLRFYDEAQDEFFLKDFTDYIKVYNREGNFLRKFKTDSLHQVSMFYNYDAESMLCYQRYQESASSNNPFFLISKLDGTLVKDIHIEVKDVNLVLRKKEKGVTYAVGIDPLYAVKFDGNYLLNEYSSDTAYVLSGDSMEIKPFFHRTPSIHSTDPLEAMHPIVHAGDYYFFSSQKKTYDFEQETGLEKEGYFMDTVDHKIYRQKMVSTDYRKHKIIIDPALIYASYSGKVGVIPYEVSELVIANEEGKLDGKLKEAVNNLTPDDGLLLMIIKFL